MARKINLLRLAFSRLSGWFHWRSPLYTKPAAHRVPAKSIFIRHVDGGSSNAAEQEITALFNPVYSLESYGYHLVASPRHADILLITGPLTRNMLQPTHAAFDAMPEPRRVVTIGDGFNDDHIFSGSYAIVPLPDEIKNAVIAHVPGDPPAPQELMDVLLKIDI